MALPTLIAALLLLLLWALLTFVLPAGLGIVHVLLGAGAMLLVRWWVVRGGNIGATGAGPGR